MQLKVALEKGRHLIFASLTVADLSRGGKNIPCSCQWLCGQRSKREPVSRRAGGSPSKNETPYNGHHRNLQNLFFISLMEDVLNQEVKYMYDGSVLTVKSEQASLTDGRRCLILRESPLYIPVPPNHTLYQEVW